jgi:hypothetical protein
MKTRMAKVAMKRQTTLFHVAPYAENMWLFGWIYTDPKTRGNYMVVRVPSCMN